MLVLTRRFGESILIGKDIKVTVMEKDYNGHIRLGIEAPRDVLVLRSELENRPRKVDNKANTSKDRVTINT